MKTKNTFSAWLGWLLWIAKFAYSDLAVDRFLNQLPSRAQRLGSHFGSEGSAVTAVASGVHCFLTIDAVKSRNGQMGQNPAALQRASANKGTLRPLSPDPAWRTRASEQKQRDGWTSSCEWERREDLSWTCRKNEQVLGGMMDREMARRVWSGSLRWAVRTLCDHVNQDKGHRKSTLNKQFGDG